MLLSSLAWTVVRPNFGHDYSMNFAFENSNERCQKEKLKK